MNGLTSQLGWYRASAAEADLRPHLRSDLDVDVCVIGGGIAGLSVALEAARLGATVAVIESKAIGWNASGASLGIVTPGFGNDASALIARLGPDDARELWGLSQDGVDRVRAIANELGDVEVTDGVLEVSATNDGDRLVRRLQMLAEVFGAEVAGWHSEQVREVLKTRLYFDGIHHPRAFHIHALSYLRGLAALVQRQGAHIFEQTSVMSVDTAGIRKRIVTPNGKMRANAIVIAGNVHLGTLFPRLVQTLRPVWRFAGVTEPIGARLTDAITFHGAVLDGEGGNRFRIIDGDRLMWSGPVRARDADPRRLRRRIESDIRATFPEFDRFNLIAMADMWSGVTGETVHGMPQIGQLNPGLWIASGFGQQGLNTAAMAGQLIARGIVAGDDRWRLFAPYELVWAGGRAGRLVGQAVSTLKARRARLAGAIARRREQARLQRYRKQGPQATAPAKSFD